MSVITIIIQVALLIIANELLFSPCGPSGPWSPALSQCQPPNWASPCVPYLPKEGCVNQAQKERYDKKGGYPLGVSIIKIGYTVGIFHYLVGLIVACLTYFYRRSLGRIRFNTGAKFALLVYDVLAFPFILALHIVYWTRIILNKDPSQGGFYTLMNVILIFTNVAIDSTASMFVEPDGNYKKMTKSIPISLFNHPSRMSYYYSYSSEENVCAICMTSLDQVIYSLKCSKCSYEICRDCRAKMAETGARKHNMCPQCNVGFNVRFKKPRAVEGGDPEAPRSREPREPCCTPRRRWVTFLVAYVAYIVVNFFILVTLGIYLGLTQIKINDPCGPRDKWGHNLIQCQRFPNLSQCNWFVAVDPCDSQARKDAYDASGGFELAVKKMVVGLILVIALNLVLLLEQALLYRLRGKFYIRSERELSDGGLSLFWTAVPFWGGVIAIFILILFFSGCVILAGGKPDITYSRTIEASAWIFYVADICFACVGAVCALANEYDAI